MSIANEITRLQTAKADLKTAIMAKGVEVADTDTIDTYASKVEAIESGGGDGLFASYLNGKIVNFVAPEGAKKIRNYAFYNDTTIKTADLSNATSRIGVEAFRGSSLEEVILPTTVDAGTNLYFGPRVFYQSKLTSFSTEFTAGSGLTSGNPALFEGCVDLKEVYMPNITINNSPRHFYGCSSLEKATIKANKLANGTFYNCSSLTTLILHSYSNTSVPTLVNTTDIFTNTPIEAGTGYIYVPKALIEKYKVATNWVAYAEQFRAIEDYPDICGGAE